MPHTVAVQDRAPGMVRLDELKVRKLGLLDEHVQSLKTQMYSIAREFETTLKDRSALLNEVGIVNWPGVAEDAILLERIWESRSNGDGAQRARQQLLQGELTGQPTANVAWRLSSADSAFRAGDDDFGAGTEPVLEAIGREKCPESMDINLLPFGGDLPTPRGIPNPGEELKDGFQVDDTVWGIAAESQLGSAPQECVGQNQGQAEREASTDGKSGVEESSGSTFCPPNPLVNPPFVPMEPQCQRPSTAWGEPAIPPTDTAGFASAMCDMGFGSGGCCAGEMCVSSPSMWMSNTVFHGGVPLDPAASLGDIPFEEPLLFDNPDCGCDHQGVQMRTTHMVLLERANRAEKMANELAQTRLALQNAQAQLEFISDRMLSYKRTLQGEALKKAAEVKELRIRLNEETSAKFIMFCKLQELESSIQMLEGKLRVVEDGDVFDESSSDFSDHGQAFDGTSSDASSLERSGSEDVLDLALRNAMMMKENMVTSTIDVHCLEDSSSTTTSTSTSSGTGFVPVNNHPLHESLGRTMRRLLEAEKRGDDLQQKVSELENQMRQLTKDATREATARAEPSENKKIRGELTRARNRLCKLESDLETSSKARERQGQELRRLRAEIKDARKAVTGRVQKWR